MGYFYFNCFFYPINTVYKEFKELKLNESTHAKTLFASLNHTSWSILKHSLTSFAKPGAFLSKK